MSAPKMRFDNSVNIWNSFKLENLISTLKSGLSRQLNNRDIGIPVIRANNIQDGNLDFTDIKYWHLDDPQGANTQNYLVQTGDVLINFINSEAKMGTTAFVDKPLFRDMIYTTNIMRMTTNEKMDSYFFYLYSQTKMYKNYIKVITKPAVNQASFTTVDFKAMDIKIPDLKEQKKIIDFFALLNKRIEKQREKVAMLQTQKRGMMQKIFSQELRFKDEDGKEFGEWNILKLGEIFKLSSGNNLSAKNFIQGIYPVYGGNGISGYHNEYLYDESQLIIGRVGALCGNINYAKGKCWITDNALLITNKLFEYETLFMYYLLTSLDLNNYANKTAQPVISGQIIYSIDVALPTLAEQEKIAYFLSSLNSKITFESERLKQLQNQKQAFMQLMFI